MTQLPYYPPAPQQQYAPAPPQQYQPPAQPQYPGYPPQQYAPAPPAPPAAPLAQGSIDDYYSQPSTGGGSSLKFTDNNNQPMIGQSYVFQVTRPIGNGDIQQQTDKDNKPLVFRDGRAKFVMIVPVQLLEPSPNHPDGLAKWYVKGAARDELARAMAEAHGPEGPPEHGAVIRVTLTGTRQSAPGMNPAHVFAVQYVRPQGAAPVQPAAAPAQPAPEAVAAPAAPAPAPAQAMPPVQPPAPAPQYAPAQEAAQQFVQQQYQPLAQQVATPAQAQQTAPQPPANLSPEQQELLARMQAQG